MYLRWTVHVPGGPVPMTARGQKARDLRSPDDAAVSQGPAPRTAEPAGPGEARAREHRAMITRIYEGTNQTERVALRLKFGK